MTAALALRDEVAIAEGRASIATHSRSFALASRLLPPDARDAMAVLYAWCRAADDAVDCAAPGDAEAALERERAELDAIYRGTAVRPVSRGFAALARQRALPEAYPRALLDGMAMDVAGARYATVDDLIDYAYRVAGVVGLMACHVLGVRDDAALVPAAHLGIAMQLTNVCRDVAEDWTRGRLYLPDELLARHGAPGLAAALAISRPPRPDAAPDAAPGPSLPPAAERAVRATVLDLLALADRYYASARCGYGALPWRVAIGVRAAARIYRAIGVRLVRRGGDALAGRVVVRGGAKVAHLGAAAAVAVLDAPRIALRRMRGARPRIPTRVLELHDVPRL